MELLYLTAAISVWHIATADNLLIPKAEYTKNYPVKYACPDVDVTEHEGIITSPNYPDLYSSHLSCSWHILGNVGDVITVYFDEVDIEESCSDLSSPCCLYNWLKVGLLTNNTEKKVCGKNFHFNYPVISSTHKLWVKFHISKYIEGGRGFKLHYKITPRSISMCKIDEFKCSNNQCVPKALKCNGFPDCEDGMDEHHCSAQVLHPDCKINELKCGDNQCIPASMRCNGVADCGDGSDEHHCSNRCSSGRSCSSVFQCYDASKHCDGIADCSDFSDEIDCGFCTKNLVRCANSTQCYNPLTQRCDKIFHCLNGEDEKDCYELCPGKIMCSSRRGCYLMKHRCNGVAQCEDASDEKNCAPELCNYEHGGFLCDNGRCIQEVWTCDRTDDCGDGSDERNCLRNSVLTAAVMGSLICALLLVIAISCTCRLHALRMLEQRLSSRETPLSRLSREFFFREPPPSYSVAVQGSQHHNLYVENIHYGIPVHRSRQRRRRSRYSRNSSVAPQVPSVSRNCVLVSPDGIAPRHQSVNASTTGESSNPIPSSDSSPVVRPVNKTECVLTVSGENSNVSKECDNKNPSVQEESICSVTRPASDSESLSIDPTNASTEENSDSVPTVDHYFCDSDSEPLVP